MSLGARLAHSARFLEFYNFFNFSKFLRFLGAYGLLGALKGRHVGQNFGAPFGCAGVAGALVTPLCGRRLVE